MQNQQISFENTPVNIIHKDGKVWLTLTDVARCLYDIPETSKLEVSGNLQTPKNGVSESERLKNAKQAVEKIFKNYQKEFERRNDTHLVRFKEGNLYRSYRIVSINALYGIAFVVKTPKAEAFRDFVLNLLNRYDNNQKSPTAELADNVANTIKSVLYANAVAMKKRETSDHLRQASEDMAKDHAEDSASLKAMRENLELEITNILIMNSVQMEILLEGGGSSGTPKPSIHDFLERSSRRMSRG